jgi:membrane fusion protein, multidrug efflux system
MRFVGTSFGAAALSVSLLLLGPAALFAADPAPVQVGTVRAEKKPVSRTAGFVGRIEAPQRVEIRARVKGMLEAVRFTEGDTVKAGTPLYLIDQSEFQASVEQAQGVLERSTAALALSTIQRQRAEELLARNAGTAVARDQAVAMEDQSKGAVTSDKASLDMAKINLGYTEIAAPITGRIGRTAVTMGNIVGPDSGVLATIVSQDPMYVTFPISQRTLAGVQKGGPLDVSQIQVSLRLSDGTLYDQKGKINFVDVSVDRTTDTVTVRAQVPNPRGALTDGQLVQVELQSGTPEERILIPQAALVADQGGVYVFIVEDDKAAVRRITTRGDVGADVIVESGLTGGELVIVDGFQTLRPGAPVRAVPARGVQAGG